MHDKFLKERCEQFPTDPRYQERGYGTDSWERRNRTIGLSTKAKEAVIQQAASDAKEQEELATPKNNQVIMYGQLNFGDCAA